MKYSLFLLINVFFVSSSISQIKISNRGITGQLFIDRQGVEYYKNGITFFNQGELTEADSLFSLALCTYENEDVYFNRAITKILLKDTIGYCSDLRISAHSYYDKKAAKLYNMTCCSHVDTNYFDRKGMATDISKYRYIEEVLYLKYDKDTIGFIHHKNRTNNVQILNYNCDFELGSMNFRITDIVGKYYIHSNRKIYEISSSPASIKKSIDYEDFMNRSQILLENKYSKVKTSINKEVSLISEFTVSETGQISNIKLVSVIPSIVDEKTRFEMEKDIIDIINHLPDLKPARMFKKDVISKISFKFKI